MKKIIGMDASRCRSGGVVAYVIGILTGFDPMEYGISQVHIWSYKNLINQLPDYPWLIKHTPPNLEKSISHQLMWQYYTLPKEIKKYECDILFNACAGSICRFTPSITISQDLLSYEPKEMQRFGFSKARLRLLLLRYIQIYSLKRSIGVIFATNYVKITLEKIMGEHKRSTIIPHGVGNEFHKLKYNLLSHENTLQPVQCIYVSNADLYKHQWHVIKAIGNLRQKGFNISLLLVGGGTGKAQFLLNQQLKKTDPSGEFIEQMNFVNHAEIPNLLSKADLFVFASSCENMPITLLEAMSAGLPIACSNRGPMPEILQEAGVYFNPEDANSITEAIEKILNDMVLRNTLSERAKLLSSHYVWELSSKRTWKFISSCVE